MRELSHENLSPDIRAAIQGLHHGKLFYLWHPDDVGTARPMPERKWFEVYQPLLVRIARTRAGRDLLGVPHDFPVVDRVDHNAIHGRIGGGETLSRFYVGAKFGNRIRYQWPEFRRIAKSIYEHWGPDGLYREPLLNWGGILVRAAATDTFYPDPDPESTTVDGWVDRTYGLAESWATRRNSAGQVANDTGVDMSWFLRQQGGGTNWVALRRTIYGFDLASISGTTVSAATLGLYLFAKQITGSSSPYAYLLAANPQSNTALVASDFNTGTTRWPGEGTPLCDDTTLISSYPDYTATPAYRTFTLNAAGISWAYPGSVVNMGVRFSADVLNSEPSGSNQNYLVNIYLADNTGTTNDPYLEVTSSTFVPRMAVII